MKTAFEWFTDRGFVDDVTSPELWEVLKNKTPFYLGIDPTAPSPHLGNWVAMIAAIQLERLGHQPIILVGGATGLIGDPSGKDAERPLLSREEVKSNVASLTEVFRKFLKNPIVVDNYDWFSKMNAIEFLRDVGKQFRMGPMLSKDSVKNRLHSEEGMSYTEFSYQVLQGYDFYYLFKHHGARLQIGGSDQYGNITAGIDLTRRMARESVYGLTLPLLVRSDGKKFGKSEKGAIWLKEELCSPFELYQYLVRVPDKDVTTMMRMLTLMDMEEILEVEKKIATEPNFAQKRLAVEVTRLIHGEKGVQEALQATGALTPGKMVFQEDALQAAAATMPNIELSHEEVVGKSYVDVVVSTGLLSSKGEARRLIQNQGAYFNGEKVTDPNFVITKDTLLSEGLCILSAGKKRSLLVRIKF